MKSLQWYERSTAFLKGQIKLLNIQHSKDLKVKVFEKIAAASLNAPIPSEPLTEEEAAQFKIINANPVKCRELVDILEQKADNERKEQEEFL